MRIRSIRSIRSILLPLVTSILFVAGCRNCDTLGAVKAAGAIEPAVFDFGPLTSGSKCLAHLKVTNKGQEDLTVKGSALEAVTGQFVLKKAPTLVRPGGGDDLLVEYTAAGADGESQSSTVKLDTDDPDDNGVLRGVVTAIVTTSPAPTAKTECHDPATSPCDRVDFGATQVNGAGITLGVKVQNDGTADMHISHVVVGNSD